MGFDVLIDSFYGVEHTAGRFAVGDDDGLDRLVSIGGQGCAKVLGL